MSQISEQPDLVAVDSEASSRCAVMFAIPQSLYEKRPLIFIHVAELEDERYKERNLPFIDDALLSAAKAGVFAESRVMYGQPREGILAAAIDANVRFVFVGMGRPKGAERWFLGSVAADVVRHSDRPVVVVPPVAHSCVQGEPLLARMLVPIDPSDNETSPAAAATFAVDFAASDARRELVFCAVVNECQIASNVAQAGGSVNMGQIYGDLVDVVRSQAHRALDSAMARALARGVRSRSSIVTGEPSGAICELASVEGATAIVMGTHGRRGLSLIILGSTTQRVLEMSEIPVLTLRQQPRDLPHSDALKPDEDSPRRLESICKTLT